MALRTIITKGDPVLSKKAHLVTNFDEKLAILLDDMVETLRDSGGVGLAAPHDRHSPPGGGGYQRRGSGHRAGQP